MPRGTISGQPFEVPDGWEAVQQDELRRLRAAANLLSDLDRSPAGRHKGDRESQDPSGVSQGNPLLPPGTHVGYDLGGRRLIVPENPADPKAWVEPRADREEKTDA